MKILKKKDIVLIGILDNDLILKISVQNKALSD